MKYYRLLFLTGILFVPALLFSQNVKVINDLRSRTTLGIVKEVANKVQLIGEIELGYEENISKIGKAHAEAGIAYSLFKFLDLEVGYRFSKNRKNYSDEYKYTHIIALSAEGKYKINRLKFYNRIQYQTIDDDAITYNPNDQNRNIYKNRIKLKYNLRKTKLSPFVYSEIYMLAGINGIDASKLKTVMGIEYPFKNHTELKIYYRNDKELTNYIPYMYHTLGFSFSFTL